MLLKTLALFQDGEKGVYLEQIQVVCSYSASVLSPRRDPLCYSACLNEMVPNCNRKNGFVQSYSLNFLK